MMSWYDATVMRVFGQLSWSIKQLLVNKNWFKQLAKDTGGIGARFQNARKALLCKYCVSGLGICLDIIFLCVNFTPCSIATYYVGNDRLFWTRRYVYVTRCGILIFSYFFLFCISSPCIVFHPIWSNTGSGFFYGRPYFDPNTRNMYEI